MSSDGRPYYQSRPHCWADNPGPRRLREMQKRKALRVEVEKLKAAPNPFRARRP